MAPKRKNGNQKSDQPAKKQKTAKEAPAMKKSMKVEKPKVDPVVEKIEAVRKVIEEKNQKGGEQVTNLMTNMIEPALKDVIENRHAFQNRVVDMVEEVLMGIQADLKAVTASKQQIIDTAETVEQQNTQDLETIVANITAKDEQITQCTATLEADEALLSEATGKKNAAEEVYGDLKKENESNQDLMTVAADGEKEFQAMIETAPEGGKAGKRRMMEFSQVLKKIECDDSLLQAAPSALQKDPETRGMFDKIAIQSIQETFQNFISSLTTKMSTQEEREAAATKDIEECGNVETAAQAKVDESEAALQTAKADLKQLKADKKQKEKDIKEHKSNVATAADEQTEAAFEETCFAETLATFVELRERTDIVPEEPEAPEEPVAMEVDAGMEDALEEPVEEEAAPAEPEAAVVEQENEVENQDANQIFASPQEEQKNYDQAQYQQYEEPAAPQYQQQYQQQYYQQGY